MSFKKDTQKLSKRSIDIYKSLTGDLVKTVKHEKILKLHAAYNGLISRYSILRSNDINDERYALARGIRHNLHFAIWYKNNTENIDKDILSIIYDRLIMSNMIVSMNCDPYCIWYPNFPSVTTLKKLLLVNEKYRYIIGRTCVIADYQELYNELNVKADIMIMKECSKNSYYYQDQLKKMNDNKLYCSSSDEYQNIYSKLKETYTNGPECYYNFTYIERQDWIENEEDIETLEFENNDINYRDPSPAGDFYCNDIMLNFKLAKCANIINKYNSIYIKDIEYNISDNDLDDYSLF